MTENGRIREIELKTDVAEELQAIRSGIKNRYHYALDDTDRRLTEYVCEVIDHPDGHNLYELLGVRRFFRLLDKYEWKAGRAKRFFRFYETLRFSGVSGRRRYKLTPVQTFQFANIFGFSDKLGRRLVRTAYLFVPRKFSKTTSAAALAVRAGQLQRHLHLSLVLRRFRLQA